jgi:sodium/potassium-transporting ATPase subunit alpha
MTGAIHRVSAREALASLRSSVDGLASAEAAVRQREFGPNRLIRTRERPAIVHLLAQLTHFFALILWAAATLALVAEYRSPGSGMRALAAAIVAVIVINGLFSFWQERRAHRRWRRCSDSSPNQSACAATATRWISRAQTLSPGMSLSSRKAITYLPIAG